MLGLVYQQSHSGRQSSRYHVLIIAQFITYALIYEGNPVNPQNKLAYFLFCDLL